MTQELEEPITEEVKSSLAEGQKEEEKYKNEIPKEFYMEYNTAEREIQRAELLFSKVFGKHVIATYDILRKVNIPVEAATIIVVGRFIKYRAVSTIKKFLPDETKDKRQQAKAIKSNLKQQAKKDKEMADALLKEGYKLGIDINERAEAGQAGGWNTVITKGNDYMSALGKNGGRPSHKEKIQHAAKLAVAEEIVDEVVANQVKEIIIELPEPDYTDEQSQARTMWSCKIEQLWNKFHKAYLKVDVNGNIKSVYNADPVARPKELEEPIANSH